MSNAASAGRVYWIDHFVVPVNDLPKWRSFMTEVFGGRFEHEGGLTTAARAQRAPIRTFFAVGHYHHIGGFLQEQVLPLPSALGAGMPRHAFYIRAGDIDGHLRRLDAAGVTYATRSPRRKTARTGRRSTSPITTETNTSFGRRNTSRRGRWKTTTRRAWDAFRTWCSNR